MLKKEKLRKGASEQVAFQRPGTSRALVNATPLSTRTPSNRLSVLAFIEQGENQQRTPHQPTPS